MSAKLYYFSCMTVQSTSVRVILATVPWSISSLFCCSVYHLRYSCSGVTSWKGKLGPTDCFNRLFYFIVLLELAGHSKYLGGPTRSALSYATVRLHAQHEVKYN